MPPEPCELCVPADVIRENALAYVRRDNHSLSAGDVPDPSGGIRCVLAGQKAPAKSLR